MISDNDYTLYNVLPLVFSKTSFDLSNQQTKVRCSEVIQIYVPYLLQIPHKQSISRTKRIFA